MLSIKTYGRMMKLVLGCLITLTGSLGAISSAHGADSSLSKDFWSADSIQWGDGRPYVQPVSKTGPYPQGFKADFTFNIPSTGWYEVIYPSAQGEFRHDLLVDGSYAWHFRATSLLSKKSTEAKAGNLWLTAGKHVLRVQRLGIISFPKAMIGGIELRPAEGRPEASVTAAKTMVDVVRAGEDLEIKVTGGGGIKDDVTYELLSSDLADPSKKPEVVGEVSFSPSESPRTKTVDVPCPAEGAFGLAARIKGGKDLLTSEFPIEVYGVVDVNHIKESSGKLQTIHSIDCVAQTDNGQPLPDGAFLECNGPTHVAQSKAGSYRESHDSTVPGAEPMLAPDDPHSYSGFSYRVDLPEIQVPYLIDVEFPDDDRRSVTISDNWIDGTTGEMVKGIGYAAKAYETGGMQPLSFTMQHHRRIFWAASKNLIIGVLTQQVGHRAAVSKITISRFDNDQIPLTKAEDNGGRTFTHWYEESESWRMLVNVNQLPLQGMARDMVGLDRWFRMARYFGVNGIGACGLGYQSAFWRNTTLEGINSMNYDQCRLAALLCEKYGMSYTPEVFANQWYMPLVTLPALADKPGDVRSVSCQGAESGPSSAPCNLNPLHPVVQKAWIDGIGELADKLRDCKSFRGVTVRADGWLFRGDFVFPSLNWGYGDWTIHKFEKDTGVQVPGKEGDPARFSQRFDFLTSAAMKDKWIKWRCDGIFDYHKRLRDRIRGDRDDLYFGIAGDFRCDPSYGLPDSFSERALGCGVDVSRLKTEDGLAVIPDGQYGFRNLGVIAQTVYDGFLDPETVDAGRGVVRAFAAYMLYHELGYSWPAEKLGIKCAPRKPPYYYCSAAIASGRNSLEKYAVVLAEQDTARLRDGGNSDIYGDPEIWNPWFAEYRALPALPFTPLDSARDPVAVWFREVPKSDGFKRGFYFYAVNREQYPIKIDLTLDGAETITRLGTGEAITPKNGVLSLDLLPYELRSFVAPSGTEITSAVTTVPPDREAYVKQRLAFAQDIADSISGPRKDDLPEKERTAFLKQLDIAWDAYKQGHLWRVRTALSMVPALKVYEDLSEMPDGLVVTAFPGLFQERPNEGHWLPKRPVLTGDKLAAFIPSGDSPVLKPSTEINPLWTASQVLMATNGVLNLDVQVPSDGLYTLKIGHVATQPGVTVASINNQSLATPAITGAINTPETFAFPSMQLQAGTTRLTLRRDGVFGIYALQLLPHLKPVPSSQWSIIGPFKSLWEDGRQMDALTQDFNTAFMPEDKVDLNAAYPNSAGKQLRWMQKSDSSIGDLNDLVISMPCRTGSTSYDMNYAVTYIHSDTDRTAQVQLGFDWWGVAWLNGERVTSNMDPKLRDQSGGADFSSWYPYAGIIKLHKGVNTLFIKQHGGSLGSAMCAWITDDPGIQCTPTSGE